jgi:aminoglycoside 3-N-acetyltransferase
VRSDRGLLAELGLRVLKAGVRALVPRRWLSRARELAIRARQLRLRSQPKIGEAQLRRILEEDLGIRPGSLVFVHSSANKMNLDFPIHRILKILRDVIGPEGTMVFPSWNSDHSGIFDLRRTPTNMGLLPELARRVPQAIRSLHPMNSMLAIGPLADELTRDHGRSKAPLDESSPLHKLAARGGKIIGLGVTSYNLALVHCPESVWLERFPVPRFSRETQRLSVIDERGHERPVDVYRPAAGPVPARDIRGYIAKHFRPDIVRDFRVSGVDFFLCDGLRFLVRADELAGRGITMYGRRKPAREVPP